jgi:Phage integrase family
LPPFKHRKAGQFRDIPVPDMIWDMVQAMPDGPLCPGIRTAYMPYSTAEHRFSKIMEHLGIEGAHTHSLRHQFATEALETDPRELANISMVLGHDSIETTLRFYIHASANAEQRIGAMMNARWTSPKASAEGEGPAHAASRLARGHQDQAPAATAGRGRYGSAPSGPTPPPAARPRAQPAHGSSPAEALRTPGLPPRPPVMGCSPPPPDLCVLRRRGKGDPCTPGLNGDGQRAAKNGFIRG